MGGKSVIKLVKPTKMFCSWTSHKIDVDNVLLSQAEAYVGTGGTRILGKSNTAMGQELRGLDSPNGVPDYSFELLPLGVGDCCSQILNFDEPFANEDNLRHF